MAIKEQNITLNKGLQMDVNPLFQGDGCLSDCLNGVTISKVGQNFCLQQDSGNGRVGTAYLPDGFIPCCTASMGNIIYLVLFNPLTKDVEVGSFPSPKTIYDTVNSNEEHSFSSLDFQELDDAGNPTGVIYNTKQYVNLHTPSLSTGDRFLVYEGSKNRNDKSNISANEDSISDVGDKEHIKDRLLRPLSYKYFVEDKEGQRHDIDYIDLWYKNDYTIPTIELDASTGVPDIDSYRKTIVQAFNSFTSKYRGSLGICWYLNIVETYTYSSILSKSSDGKIKVSLYVTWDDESEKKAPSGFYLLNEAVSNKDSVLEILVSNNSNGILQYDKITPISNYYNQANDLNTTVSDLLSRVGYTDETSNKRYVTVNDDIKYYNDKLYINATHIKDGKLGYMKSGEFKEAPTLDTDPNKFKSDDTFYSEFNIRYLHKSISISNLEVDSKYINNNLLLSIAPCLGNYGVVMPLSRDLSIPLVINETDHIIINKWQYSVTADTLYLSMDMIFPSLGDDLNTSRLILKFYVPFKDDNDAHTPVYTRTIRLNGATYISSQIAIPVVNSDKIESGALTYGFLYGTSITVTYSRFDDLIELDSNNHEINNQELKTSKFLWCSRMFNIDSAVDDYDNVKPVLNLIPTLDFGVNSDEFNCSETGIIEKGSYVIKCSVKNKYMVDTDQYETLYLNTESDYYKDLLDNINIVFIEDDTDSTTNSDSGLSIEKECSYDKTKSELDIILNYTITAQIESQITQKIRYFVPFLNDDILRELGLQLYKDNGSKFIIPKYYVFFNVDYSHKGGHGKGCSIGINEYDGINRINSGSETYLTTNEGIDEYFNGSIFVEQVNKQVKDAIMFVAFFRDNKETQCGYSTGDIGTNSRTLEESIKGYNNFVIFYRNHEKNTNGYNLYFPCERTFYGGNSYTFFTNCTKALAPLLNKFTYLQDKTEVIDHVSLIKHNTNINIPITITSTSSDTNFNQALCIQSYKISDYINLFNEITELRELDTELPCVNPKIKLNEVDTYISFNKLFSNNTTLKAQLGAETLPSIRVYNIDRNFDKGAMDIIDTSNINDDSLSFYRGKRGVTTRSREVLGNSYVRSIKVNDTDDLMYYQDKDQDDDERMDFKGTIDYYSTLEIEDSKILWEKYKLSFDLPGDARLTAYDGSSSNSNHSNFYFHTDNKPY